MKSSKIQTVSILVFAGLLFVGTFALISCKKKSEPVTPAETTEVISEAVEQKTCPVMEAPINKEIYTEYKGKKVYFCCPGCKEKFEAESEKYLSKLPQFNN